MEKRSKFRRNRRTRKTRYRPKRFNNRRRPEGWLPPSLLSRVANIETWAKRLQRLCPISGITYELNQFDTQKMENADISGVEYQQGELLGYEVRQYVLEKFDDTCAYCGKTDVPLEIEHIVPKVRGGTDRVSNLAASCVLGRVAVRKNGSFNIKTREETVQGISYRYCKLLQSVDGYGYAV